VPPWKFGAADRCGLPIPFLRSDLYRSEEIQLSSRTHYITTTDRATIGGAVRGDGQPVAFVHGMLGDGDLDWTPLIGYLEHQFACHLPSQRGRGLSGDHPDLSYGRQVDDLVDYIDSVGEPIGLVGWSGGAWQALHAAAQSDAVAAVAVVEPESIGLAGEQEQAAFAAAVERARELVSAGDLTVAIRPLANFVFNDKEIVALEDAGYLDAAARYIPNLLSFLQQLMKYMGRGGTIGDDPTVLGAISAPVLVLQGSETKPLAAASAQHVADNVPNARVGKISGAGHAAPLTHPEELAEALARFLATTRQPV